MTSLRSAAGAIAGRAVALLRPETVLVVPVLDAEPAVGAWLGTSKVDFDGVPLHVSVMCPFLPARSVRQPDEQRIAELAAEVEPFDFALTHLRAFPGVHYLAPEPAAPFVGITEAIQRGWPSCQPYGGAYDSVIPHMTVAFGDDPPADPADLERSLPFVTRASELWLLEQTPRGWLTRRRFPSAAFPAIVRNTSSACRSERAAARGSLLPAVATGRRAWRGLAIRSSGFRLAQRLPELPPEHERAEP